MTHLCVSLLRDVVWVGRVDVLMRWVDGIDGMGGLGGLGKWMCCGRRDASHTRVYVRVCVCVCVYVCSCV